MVRPLGISCTYLASAVFMRPEIPVEPATPRMLRSHEDQPPNSLGRVRELQRIVGDPLLQPKTVGSFL